MMQLEDILKLFIPFISDCNDWIWVNLYLKFSSLSFAETDVDNILSVFS
jgi:hypothetical protein